MTPLAILDLDGIELLTAGLLGVRKQMSELAEEAKRVRRVATGEFRRQRRYAAPRRRKRRLRALRDAIFSRLRLRS